MRGIEQNVGQMTPLTVAGIPETFVMEKRTSQIDRTNGEVPSVATTSEVRRRAVKGARAASRSQVVSNADTNLIVSAAAHPEDYAFKLDSNMILPETSSSTIESKTSTTTTTNSSTDGIQTAGIKKKQSGRPKNKDVYSSTILDDKMTDKGRDFFTLREDKFFASHEDVSTDPFHTAVIINNLPSQERTKTLITLNSLRNALGVQSFNEIPNMLKNREAQVEVSRRFYKLIGTMYGIKGSVEDIEAAVEGFAVTANEVIDAVRADEEAEHATAIEPLYEVSSTSDPVQLLLMTFDNSYDPRLRFEAKRKIVFMFLAANIDLRAEEIDIDRKQRKFDEFLTEWVFKNDRKGHVERVFYLPTFDRKTFECQDVKVLTEKNKVNFVEKTYIDPEPDQDPDTAEIKLIGDDQKLIGAARRSFTYKGENIKIQVKNPPKATVRKLLKLMRKGVGNPALAVDDDVRMMGIVEDYADITRFMAHLQNSAIKAGSFMDFESVEDTIHGGKRTETIVGDASKNGGSSEVQMVKFHARFGLPGEKPIYFEGILHTCKTYMNYEYMNKVAHREFATRRFFGEDDELASADLIFPKIHFGIEQKLAREQRLSKVRSELNKESAGVNAT